VDPGPTASGRGEKIMASRQLTGRPALPGALVWLVVVLGLLVVALVAFLLLGGGG
jgi:hypothetical protein